MGNSRVKGRARSMPAGLALGALGSLGITLSMAVVGAKLMDIGTLDEGSIGYVAIVILLMSSFCGGLIAVGNIKRQKLLVCALSALVYYCTLLSMTALCFRGQYQGMGVTALMVLCGSALAAMLVMRQGRGAKRGRVHKKAHR